MNTNTLLCILVHNLIFFRYGNYAQFTLLGSPQQVVITEVVTLTITCTTQQQIIRWYRNKSAFATIIGENTDGSCQFSGSENKQYTYNCVTSSGTYTVTETHVTITGELANTVWECGPFVGSGAVNFTFSVVGSAQKETILSANGSLFVEKDQNLNITCKINTNENIAYVQFVRNGDKDSTADTTVLISDGIYCYPGDKFSCDHDKKEYTLMLESTEYADGDRWTCSLNSINQSKNVTIVVSEQPTSEPAISIEPPGAIIAGDNIKLKCSVTGGNPLAAITWDCSGSTNEKTESTESEAASSIILTVSKSDNDKVCTCKASHILWSTEQTTDVTLDVLYAPDANPVVQQSPLGAIISSTEVTLTCTVPGGNPLPILQWNCTGISINNTSGDIASYSIVFTVNKNYNNKMCTCAATHPVTSYQPSVLHRLVVYYAPDTTPVTTQSPSGPSFSGEKVTLTCSVSGGNPLAVLSWNCSGNNNNNTSGNTASYSVEFSVDNTYNNRICTCSGSHSVTSYKPTVHHRLVVYYAPDSTPTVQQTPEGAIVPGKKVTLTCTLSGGHPLAVLSWDCNGSYTNNTSGNTSSYSVEFTADTTYSTQKICNCSATHLVKSYRPLVEHKLEIYCSPQYPQNKDGQELLAAGISSLVIGLLAIIFGIFLNVHWYFRLKEKNSKRLENYTELNTKSITETTNTYDVINQTTDIDANRDDSEGIDNSVNTYEEFQPDHSTDHVDNDTMQDPAGHKHGFGKGFVPCNKLRTCIKSAETVSKFPIYKRLTRKMTNLVENVPYKEDKSAYVSTATPAKLLRPNSNTKQEPKSGLHSKKNQNAESSTNRTINIKLNAIMWNAIFKDHNNRNPYCDGFLEWDLTKEQRWGLGNSEVAKCSKCNYVSQRFKLYEEANTDKCGRKAAKMNVTVQAALSQTPISSTSFRKIILGTNSPAPSIKGLQLRANAVLLKIAEINKKDMRNRRKKLVEINKLKGKQNPHAVSLQGDGAYNNPAYSGIGHTPFQPATQVVYTMAENETMDKDIIAVVSKNKLCSNHPTGQTEHCASSCSSNLTFMKSIGDEYSWAKEALIDLKSDGIEARHFTTDPDSSAFRAAEDLYDAKVTSVQPEHFLDTRHLENNHRKNIKKCPQILKMMPGRIKVLRTKEISKFAIDLAERCHSEFQEAIHKYGGNYHKMQNKISYIVDAIPLCYTGDHSVCYRHSFVCKGGKKFWLAKRSLLDSNFKVQNNSDNISALRKCVNYRLGPKALKQTKLNLNTQKCEGFNRSLRRSLPKNVTFTKNFEGRVHAAIHSVNLGPGESLLVMCSELGVPLTSGSSVEHSLKMIQKADRKQKDCKKTHIYKTSQGEKRKYLYKLYAEQQETRDYEENKLLRTADKKLTSAGKSDHAYSKSVGSRRRKLIK